MRHPGRGLVLGVSLVVAPQFAAPGRAQSVVARDSIAVAEAVALFHASLAKGDSAAATQLLADDLIVLESGEMEMRSDYLAHHLPADIAFAKAVPSSRVVNRITVVGDAAWLIATSTTSGTFEGRTIRSEGRELMVLRRTPAGWRIAAIHWSSHRPRP